MTVSILSGRLKPVHAWRELAAFLFLPADVIWMTGWYCLLTDGQATLPIGEIYLTLVLVNVLAYHDSEDAVRLEGTSGFASCVGRIWVCYLSHGWG